MTEQAQVDAAEVIRACRQASITVSTAESITAGLVAARLADVPGSSSVLRGGVVAYATQVKADLLGLPWTMLDHVVSDVVARRMAESVADLLGTTLAVSTTGVAGPDWLDGQPPGTAWIAVHDRRGTGRTRSMQVQAMGTRAQVRDAVVQACLVLLMEATPE